MDGDLGSLNRFSPSVCFVLPVRDGRGQDELESLPQERTTLSLHGSMTMPPVSSTAAVRKAGIYVRLRWDEVARPSQPLTLAGYVADVGGATTVVLGLAAGARKIWQKLRQTKRGIVSISSGAAGLLALADAASRHGSRPIKLVSFGALDADADSSFSEFDVFWAVIEVIDSEVIEFYLISDKGDVTFAAERSGPSIPLGAASPA